MRYIKELREHFKNRVVFTISDLKIFLKPKGISRGYLHLLLHNLISKGEIKRITKGVYTFRDEIEVVGFASEPFYYGLQEALSLKNLWEQETNPVVITPRKVRSGIKNFEGKNYVVKRINRKMFFGFEWFKYEDFWIPVSDAEKTLIDFIYFKESLDMETLKEIKRRLDEKRLRAYLKRSPKWVNKRVIDMLQDLNK